MAEGLPGKNKDNLEKVMAFVKLRRTKVHHAVALFVNNNKTKRSVEYHLFGRVRRAPR